MHNQDARVREYFTVAGGTVMGAEADEAVGGSQMERATWGMIGGGFGVAGRGSPREGGCELVLSCMGAPVARCRFDREGRLVEWVRL